MGIISYGLLVSHADSQTPPRPAETEAQGPAQQAQQAVFEEALQLILIQAEV